ncbi:MAG: hypothetical protein Q7U96_04235 [Chloroflexota bacterium]|nr:hypothetical protein [Chloroflexota bacterium]
MEDEHATTSSVINFVERLEEESSGFYQNLAARFPVHSDTFLAYAREGAKNRTLVVRTYRETITDMLEACYCFEGLNLSEHVVKTTLGKRANLAGALKAAVELERKAVKYYLEIADRSQSLLATIPKAFRKVAETRGRRKTELERLLAGAE